MKTRKIVSLLLSLLMIMTVIPMTALESTAASYYETESNDTYASADMLPLNSSISGCMYDSYDEDVYKVTTSKNGKLSLTFTHNYEDSGAGWSIDIYQYKDGQYKQLFDRQYIALNDKETYQLIPIGAVAGGVYFIKVYVSHTTIGSVDTEYGLTSSFSATEYYERELNDSYATATKMTLNKTYKGCMSDSNDIDIYKVTTSKNGKLSLTFTHNYEDSGAGWSIDVYQYKDGQYKQLFDRQYIALNDKETYQLIPIGAVAGGVYFIKVYVSHTTIGSVNTEYGLTVSDKLPKPTPKVANKNGYVSITWSKSAGAKGYYVYRKGPNDKSWKRISNVTGTSFKDKNVKSGTNYTYTVKAYNGSTYSSYHSGVAIKYLAQPTVKTANKNGYVSITWSKSAGAKGYYVYRKGPNDKSWKRIGNVTGTSFKDKNVKSGTNYTYTVKAYNGSTYSSYNSGIAIKYLAQPTFKVANKSSYVSITWNKTAGAKGYYVYRKGPNDKSWKRIGNVTGTSFKDKNVKSGTNYTYTVKAYNGSTYSSYNSGIAIKYLAQPTFKVANKSSYVSITWNKTAGAKGYYVYRKGPNDKSWVRIANVTGKSYSDKKVKRNVKYTYTVKAYNGSYNSSYHSGVTVKH